MSERNDRPETFLFGIFGFLTLSFGGLVLYLSFFSQRAQPDPASNLRVIVFLALTAVTAIGLIFQRKWAAILFSLATGMFSFWLIIGSIAEVPFPFLLINLVMGLLLLSPLLATISCWSSLKSNERFYF